MTLLDIKLLSAALLFLLVLLTGWGTIGFAHRYRHQLELGDAMANGIFIGAAVFHLIPDAIDSFIAMGFGSPIFTAIFIAVSCYVCLCLVQFFFLNQQKHDQRLNTTLLVLTLSVHAVIAGIALGISPANSVTITLLLAILSHKAFETFAFVVKIPKNRMKSLLIAFATLTPAGILLGILGDENLSTHMNHLLTPAFAALAAGTFLYIGTIHTHHLHERDHEKACHGNLTKVFIGLIGVALMGGLALYI